MRKQIVATFAALCIGVAACGGDDDSSQEGGQDSGSQDSASTATADSTDGADSDQATDANGVLRMGYDLIAQPTGGFSLDPAAGINANTTHLGIHHWIYGALMRPLPDGTLEPDLAESATLVDEQTIEVVVRDGLTLADGSPFDAEAVKAALDHNLSLTPEESGFEPAFFSLESVEVTEPGTLELHVPDGAAASWYDVYLASKETVIVPDGTNFDQPAGAGPFTVVEFTPEQSLVLEKNPEYWNADEIQVAGIEIVNTPAASQAGVNALQADQVDWVYLEYSQIDAVGDDLEVTATPSHDLLALFHLCKSEPPFDDARIRQALSYAIDRDAINEAVFGGTGEAAWGLFPESSPLHNEELDGYYEYDPDRAQELLAEAGYADGFSFDMIPIESGNVPEMAQIVQQQWAEIGVTMNITPSPDFVQALWIDNRAPMGAVPIVAGDPRGRLDYFDGDEINNTCDYSDPELADMVAQLDTISNSSDEAAEIWADAQELVMEDALSIFLLFRPSVHAFDGEQLSGVTSGGYSIPVPDIWQLSVNA